MRVPVWLFPLLVLAATISGAQAQSPSVFSLVLRGVEASTALDLLVERAGIDLIYGEEVTAASNVYCALTDATAEDHLRCIVREAGLDFYRLSSGTYVITERALRAPRRGSLSGIVVDAETGEPLPYANVYLADASTGTATGVSGHFTLANVLSGPHALMASYVGYTPAVDSVLIPEGGQVRRRIALRPDVRVLSSQPLVVDGLVPRLPSAVLGQDALSQDGSERGGRADVLQESISRSGLGVRWPLADLHIQGGEDGEHRMTLDGIPVFEPLSLGRLLSAFSPLAVGRVTIRKAGFGASSGSHLAGVIEAEHLQGSSSPSVTARADTYSLDARATTPLRAGNVEGSVLVAARAAIWPVYPNPSLDTQLRAWNRVDPLLTSTWLRTSPEASSFAPHRHGSDLDFSDLHFASRLRLTSYRTVSLTGYRGTNDVSTELFGASDIEETGGRPIMLSRDDYRWVNEGAQFTVSQLVGARSFATAQVLVARHALTHDYAMQAGTALPGTSTEQAEAALSNVLRSTPTDPDLNSISETGLEGTFSYSFSPQHILDSGIELRRLSHHVHLGGQDAPVGRGFRLLDRAGAPVFVAGYAEHTWTVNATTTLETGTRLTYVPDRQTVYAEPRLALRLDRPGTILGPASFRVATGLYRQFVNAIDLSTIGPSALMPTVRFWLPVDRELAPPYAYHSTIESLLQPAPGWSIRSEAYLKVLPRVWEPDYAVLLEDEGTSTTSPDFVVPSRGTAYGAGLTAEHQTSTTTSRLSYTFSHAERVYPGRFDERSVVTPWNQPHRLSASFDARLGRGFSARALGRGIWGRAWAFRQGYYDYLAAHHEGATFGMYRIDTPERDRPGALLQVDLGVGYERTLGLGSVQLGLELQNVLDRRNVIDWSLVPDGEGAFVTLARTLPGITPALSLRVTL